MRHVGLQRLARVFDRHFDLERRDVVLVNADGRDLCDAPLEDAIAERLGGDAGELADTDTTNVGFIHLPAHEDPLDIAEREHERAVGAEVQDGRHGAANLDVTRQHCRPNRRLDGRVGELFFRAFERRARLRDIGGRLGDLRAADHQLSLRGRLPVHRLVERVACLVER